MCVFYVRALILHSNHLPHRLRDVSLFSGTGDRLEIIQLFSLEGSASLSQTPLNLGSYAHLDALLLTSGFSPLTDQAVRQVGVQKLQKNVKLQKGRISVLIGFSVFNTD